MHLNSCNCIIANLPVRYKHGALQKLFQFLRAVCIRLSVCVMIVAESRWTLRHTDARTAGHCCCLVFVSAAAGVSETQRSDQTTHHQQRTAARERNAPHTTAGLQQGSDHTHWAIQHRFTSSFTTVYIGNFPTQTKPHKTLIWNAQIYEIS